MPVLVAYDRRAGLELIRQSTPQELLTAIQNKQAAVTLSEPERSALIELLSGWTQRALGEVTLRDAMLADEQRGVQVYRLLCIALTQQSVEISHEAADCYGLTTEMRLVTAQDIRTGAAQQNAVLSEELEVLLCQSEQGDLALIFSAQVEVQYPYPDNLEELLPDLPPPLIETFHFEQPSGIRRTLALLLVIAGVSWLVIPLLFGKTPLQPAAFSLGLLTLALLVGIRASWSGYLGSLCIWLVPNLPWFRHGSHFAWMPTIILLLIGCLLLALDAHIRSLWRWIRKSVVESFG